MKVHNLLVTGSLTSGGENISTISSSVADTITNVSSSISASINDLSSSMEDMVTNMSSSFDTTISTLATTGSNLFVGTQTISGSIIPAVNNTYDLGTATQQFRDLYLSSASLYIDGVKVLGSTAQELQITTDAGQSFKILEAGSDTITLQSNDGNITLATSGGGDVILDPTSGIVALKGTTTIYAGNRVLSSDGNAIQFGNSVTMTGSLVVTGFIETQELRTTYISSSILYRSGSTKFGDELTDTHDFTGSLNISGSISVPGSNLVSGSSQITYSGLSGVPSGIVSGSAQVDVLSTTNIARLATTGSNIFTSNQVVTGSISSTGNIKTEGVLQWNNGIGALSYGGGSVTMETNTTAPILLKTNGTTAITISTGQTVTFVSSVTAEGTFFGKLNAVYQNSSTNILNVGTDQNMYGGTNSDGGVFVYGNNKLHLSTNSVRRLTVGGSGNVGIGTTNPGNFDSLTFTSPILDVVGSLNIKGIAANGASAINLGGETYRKASIYTSIQDQGPYLGFAVASSGTSSTTSDVMRITSGGNVGIGTTAPDGKLDVVGDISYIGNTNNSVFVVRNNGSFIGGGGSGTSLIVQYGGQNIATLSNTGTGQRDAILSMRDEGVVKVRIAANNSRGGDTIFNGGGNVAIGTDTASQRLTVNGGFYTSGDQLNDSGYYYAGGSVFRKKILNVGDNTTTTLLTFNQNGSYSYIGGGEILIVFVDPGSPWGVYVWKGLISIRTVQFGSLYSTGLTEISNRSNLDGTFTVGLETSKDGGVANAIIRVVATTSSGISGQAHVSFNGWVTGGSQPV